MAVFVVNNTGDSGPGTLRQAMLDANAAAGPDDIHFDIAGDGVQTITPQSQLPAVSDVVIDGYTQPGARPNTLALGTDAVLRVEVRCDAADLIATGGSCFVLTGRATVRGLVVNQIVTGRSLAERVGITLAGTGNVVEGNYVGTDATGMARRGGGSRTKAVALDNADGNRIGGTSPAARNVIGGTDTNVHLRTGSDGNRVEGNYIGLRADGTAALNPAELYGSGVASYGGAGNVFGGTAPGAQNVLSGLLYGAIIVQPLGPGETIEGNFIGTDATGTYAVCNGVGVFSLGVVGAAGNEPRVGGRAPGAGNLISGNTGVGLYLGGASVAEGNRIGTDLTGTRRLPNHAGGVVANGPGNTIGGTVAAARNVISGNGVAGDASAGNGLTLENSVSGSTATGTLVRGNYIGTDVTGTQNLGNEGHGVRITTQGPNTIGGTLAAAANTIAFNGGDGVSIAGAPPDGQQPLAGGAAVLGNSIHSNAGLGIDLADDGVTGNDAGGDLDGFPGDNGRQNFPVLASASTPAGGTTTTVTGTLNSAPTTTYRLEFFASRERDPSGHGEGETYVGSAQVTTGADGTATFAAPLPVAVPPGRYLTATATDPAGNTSEFSAALRLAAVVTGRHVFYNNSAYDGGDPLPNAADEAAVDPAKSPLLPGGGGTASAANVTSYSRGINGVMFDLLGMPNRQIGPEDVAVRVGPPAGSEAPDAWSTGPGPSLLSARPGPGGDGHRLTFVWPDGALTNRWVEVTLLANGDTGLAAPDVFYLANLVGDADGNRAVNLADFGAVRQDFGRSNLPVTGGRSDFNRDGKVDLGDFGLLRGNFGKSLSLSPPPPTLPAAFVSAAPEDSVKRRTGTSSSRPADDLASA